MTGEETFPVPLVNYSGYNAFIVRLSPTRCVKVKTDKGQHLLKPFGMLDNRSIQVIVVLIVYPA